MVVLLHFQLQGFVAEEEQLLVTGSLRREWGKNMHHVKVLQKEVMMLITSTYLKNKCVWKNMFLNLLDWKFVLPTIISKNRCLSIRSVFVFLFCFAFSHCCFFSPPEPSILLTTLLTLELARRHGKEMATKLLRKLVKKIVRHTLIFLAIYTF